MAHYKIRSTKESLKKIFSKHMDHVSFSFDKNNITRAGVCDVLVIPKSNDVEKIIQNHFIHIKIETDELGYSEHTQYY